MKREVVKKKFRSYLDKKHNNGSGQLKDSDLERVFIDFAQSLTIDKAVR